MSQKLTGLRNGDELRNNARMNIEQNKNGNKSNANLSEQNRGARKKSDYVNVTR
jgi:hypothetical protein